MHEVGDGATSERDLRLAALGLGGLEGLQQPGGRVGGHRARVVVPEHLRGHAFEAFVDAAAFFFAFFVAAAAAVDTSFRAVAA